MKIEASTEKAWRRFILCWFLDFGYFGMSTA